MPSNGSSRRGGAKKLPAVLIYLILCEDEIMKNLIRKILKRLKLKSSHLQYSGPYVDWQTAVNSSVGYDSPYALKKVSAAVEKVLNGNCSYERDGITFDTPPKDNKLRSLLGTLHDGNKNIVDFGGGLGGTFINNRDIFNSFQNGEYYVIEQSNFCERGAELSRKYGLPIKFESDLDSLKATPDILVFSGVLQYIEDWEDVVSRFLLRSPSHIIIDRQPFTSDKNIILVQENDGYYEQKVSFPSWILNKDHFISAFKGYKVIEEWVSDFDPPDHLGFLMEKEI